MGSEYAPAIAALITLGMLILWAGLDGSLGDE